MGTLEAAPRDSGCDREWVEIFVDAVERLRSQLQEGNVVARRRILKSFVTKIEVGKEKGTLYYTFSIYALALDNVVL